MDIQLQPGSYVVAVSGGVDSSALLHHLYAQNWRAAAAGQPTSKLIVAHYNHGIRENSDKDRFLVQALAKAYGLPFVYDAGRLGPHASEATARAARYKFLRSVQRASNSRAIITAHHQDDLLETAVLNLLRGTGRKGLTALNSRPGLHRPALHLPKQALIDYAKDQGLVWREDDTNNDPKYLRNYVRHYLLTKFDDHSQQQLRYIIIKLQQQNHELDNALVNLLHQQSKAGKIDRRWFNHLPHAVAREVLATWLRAYGWRQIDRRGIERLVVAAKVAQSGKLFPLSKGHNLKVGTKYLALSGSER